MSSDIEDYPDDDGDIERVEEYEENTEQVEQAGEGDNEDGEEHENKDGDDNDTKKKVEKPKRVIRNPQPKLNDQTLRGPRGLGALPGYFERVKFKGRGHEQEDLNVLLKTYEYWCHRLFPKFPFDDCIEKLEKLGTKKSVQAHIRRIRMDIDFDDIEEKKVVSDDEPDLTEANDTQFDELIQSSKEPSQPELSEEQLERMRLNKEKAELLKQQRLKKIMAKAAFNLDDSNSLPNTQHMVAEDHQNQSDTNTNNVEIQFGSTSKKKNKRNVIDSGSEDESDSASFQSNMLECDSITQNSINDRSLISKDVEISQQKRSNKKSKRNVIDSEDESDSSISQLNLHESDSNTRNTKKKNIRNIIDSDSEDDSSKSVSATRDSIHMDSNIKMYTNEQVSQQSNTQDSVSLDQPVTAAEDFSDND